MMLDRKSTRLNSSHTIISYAVFCLKKKKTTPTRRNTTPCVLRGTQRVSESARHLRSAVPRGYRLIDSLLGPAMVRVFFFNDTATTNFHPLPLPDPLPI